MRKFIFNLDLSLETVDNTLLKCMADAWPMLEELCISYESDDDDDDLDHDGRALQPTTQITVDGLRALAACPNLTKFEVAFNARLGTLSTTMQSLPQAMGTCNISLRYLAVGNSTISNARALAAVLSEMFPNLESIRTHWLHSDPFYEQPDEQSALWRECSVSYHWFVAVRKQERESFERTCSKKDLVIMN
ncbi:hypothetical protein FIBSPDRAFT_24587 [Athelia psychrophila]|uniref:F-box domain-containing protein n=1 Tax=Athelia psychrophila TaxID=1759441 RepID=A0A166G810_9AGAM|nr:hypothetical protein FIBSPDRAFT_24587 [Fibularhizoctonia sp. CBS 109695]